MNVRRERQEMSKNELQGSGEPRSGGKAFVRRLCEWRGVNSNMRLALYEQRNLRRDFQERKEHTKTYEESFPEKSLRCDGAYFNHDF